MFDESSGFNHAHHSQIKLQVSARESDEEKPPPLQVALQPLVELVKGMDKAQLGAYVSKYLPRPELDLDPDFFCRTMKTARMEVVASSLIIKIHGIRHSDAERLRMSRGCGDLLLAFAKSATQDDPATKDVETVLFCDVTSLESLSTMPFVPNPPVNRPVYLSEFRPIKSFTSWTTGISVCRSMQKFIHYLRGQVWKLPTSFMIRYHSKAMREGVDLSKVIERKRSNTDLVHWAEHVICQMKGKDLDLMFNFLGPDVQFGCNHGDAFFLVSWDPTLHRLASNAIVKFCSQIDCHVKLTNSWSFEGLRS